MNRSSSREKRAQRPIKLPIWSFWVGLATITKHEGHQLNIMKFLSQRCAVSFWTLYKGFIEYWMPNMWVYLGLELVSYLWNQSTDINELLNADYTYKIML